MSRWDDGRAKESERWGSGAYMLRLHYGVLRLW